jgi:hypothetical protein
MKNVVIPGLHPFLVKLAQKRRRDYSRGQASSWPSQLFVLPRAVAILVFVIGVWEVSAAWRK